MWPPLKIVQRRPSGGAPKNTFPLLDSALREGAEGIAIDVKLSADGVPVVICDSPYNRPAPSCARLLSEFLQWVGEQKCTAYIAIFNPSPGAEIKVLKEINRAKVRHLARVIADSLPELQRLRHKDAKVHLGLRFTGRPPSIRQAKALGAEVLLPHWKATSPSFICRAHRASLLVTPWTMDSPRQMRRTILDGVDGIITNYPAKLTETLVRLQKARRAVAVSITGLVAGGCPEPRGLPIGRPLNEKQPLIQRKLAPRGHKGSSL
jgi:glycerophosphoryl diester phosphodiesterase